ncbi:MAG: hypothetical protein M3R36_03715 [Bacteroidota bacterium]|nr:hypothetical protein [Bacteroidota bacterium]
MTYKKHQKLNLKDNPNYDEAFIKSKIIEDPSILGLGKNLKTISSELMTNKGGRIDLILEDQDTDINKKYIVELQLGKTNESHIIRTIEYWDLYRNKFKNSEYIAVIIAEEITNRFFNVISLFNKSVPIIAIQLNALNVDEHLILHFTKILDESNIGMLDFDNSGQAYEPITSESFINENRIPKEMMDLSNDFFKLAKEIDPALTPNYTKGYMGVQKGDRINNFFIIKPKKKFIKPIIYLSNIEDWSQRLIEKEIEIVNKDHIKGSINLRLTSSDFENVKEILKEMLKQSYEECVE